MKQSPPWDANSCSQLDKKFGTKDSLPCSQEPATAFYYESDESSPHPPTLLP
jgi:hypothetical protein